MTSVLKTLSVLILGVMTTVACSAGGVDPGSSRTESADAAPDAAPDDDLSMLAPAPVRFADCDALMDHIHTEYPRWVGSQLFNHDMSSGQMRPLISR